jgi:hypothetical protein
MASRFFTGSTEAASCLGRLALSETARSERQRREVLDGLRHEQRWRQS